MTDGMVYFIVGLILGLLFMDFLHFMDNCAKKG